EKVTTKEEIHQVFENAKNPKHAAISLAGEPTLYPRIGELVAEFRHRNMCTFIVTNGTHPDVIKKLWKENNLPTQLYVTLAAPTKRDFSKICRPLTKNAWENLNETLSMIPQLPCRTVVRITSVKYLNINDEMVETYANILKTNPPNFVDIKGFTVEANALKLEERLGRFKEDHELREFAPSFHDLLHFAQKLAEATGFEIIETHEASKDILLRANWPKGKSIKIDFENV
ncbi:MAG: 4-demethylwyosine synthase TYW1, partial [Promethearchaeota archaeon]